MTATPTPSLLILNQMAGPLTWQFAEDFARAVGPVAMLTGHPDTLAKGNRNNVILFASAPATKGSFIERAISWVRYCWQAARWLRSWDKEIPVLVFSTPPLLPWLSCLYRMLRGQRYAVMVHDVYPDVLTRTGRLSADGLVVRAWRALNRLAYERADIVMTLGDYMARQLQMSFDSSRTRYGSIEVVPPWADTDAIRPMPKEENPFAQTHVHRAQLTVMYSGNMGLSHDIEVLLDAAEQLRDNSAIHFMFIGSGPKWTPIGEAIRVKRLNNITLLPWQPEDVIPFSLAAADVALISLKRELTGIMLPSKTFSFMAAGVPLLISSGETGELADLVTRHRVGWKVPAGDAAAIVELLPTLLEPDVLVPYRAASRRTAEEIGSRANSRRMVELMSRLCCRT